jgi:hypothetical protein
MLKTFLVYDEVRTERIKKDKKIIAAKLNRGGREKNYGLCMIAEKFHGFMPECVLVADMVRLVHDYKIKTWRWVELKKPFSVFLSLVAG